MLEQRRAEYLSLLGIDQYVPRRLLPAAPEPVLLEAVSIDLESIDTQPVDASHGITAAASHLDESDLVSPKAPQHEIDSSVSSEGLPEVPPNNVSLESASSLTGLMDTPAEPTNTLARVEQDEDTGLAPEALSPGASAVEKVEFVLSVWCIHDQLLVIDTREPGTAYPTDRLLQNILRAMGYPLAQLPVSETIRWPVFSGHMASGKYGLGSVEQERDQARAMVQAFVTAQVSKRPVKALLCMGESAAQFCLDGEAEAKTKDNDGLQKTADGLPVVITPSLYTLLQEPMLKASAWQALQALVRVSD